MHMEITEAKRSKWELTHLCHMQQQQKTTKGLCPNVCLTVLTEKKRNYLFVTCACSSCSMACKVFDIFIIRCCPMLSYLLSDMIFLLYSNNFLFL